MFHWYIHFDQQYCTGKWGFGWLLLLLCFFCDRKPNGMRNRNEVKMQRVRLINIFFKTFSCFSHEWLHRRYVAKCSIQRYGKIGVASSAVNFRWIAGLSRYTFQDMLELMRKGWVEIFVAFLMQVLSFHFYFFYCPLYCQSLEQNKNGYKNWE